MSLYTYCSQLGLKGTSHQIISVAIMIKLLLKSFLVYHSPIFKAWKVPKRPVEVSCDITQHLVAYRTAVGTQTNSSGMRTHTGQYSWLQCMHALFCLISCTKRTEIVQKLTTSQRTCAVQRQRCIVFLRGSSSPISLIFWVTTF